MFFILKVKVIRCFVGRTGGTPKNDGGCAKGLAKDLRDGEENKGNGRKIRKKEKKERKRKRSIADRRGNGSSLV